MFVDRILSGDTLCVGVWFKITFAYHLQEGEKMRVYGYSTGWTLRRNSDAFGDVVGQGGPRLKPHRVAISETKMTMLSLLRDDEKFSLLATHMMHMCRVPGSAQVTYGRCGRVKSIRIDGAEYQEQEGKISTYKD